MQADDMKKERAYNVQDEEKAEMEFREKEKCLENGEQTEFGARRGPKEPKNSRLAELSQQAKSLTTKKTTLAIILLCVLLFVFFIIIIALSVQVGQLSKSDDTNYCKSPECLRSAAHVAAKLNSTFSPCDNFWEYACGGWLRKHEPLPRNKGSLSVIDQVKENVQWKLRHRLDLIPYKSDSRSYDVLVKEFYESCVTNDAKDYLAKAKMDQIIQELEGWELTNNWKANRWNREEVLQRLHTKYGIAPFFEVSVGPDELDREKNIIKIVPAGLTLPSKHFYKEGSTYENAMISYLTDFARALGALPDTATKFATVVYGFEKRIAGESPPPEAFRQPERFYKRMTVNDLRNKAPTIAWKDILQLYYPSANVQDYTEIGVFDEKYFEGISTVISSSNDPVMHHYFMWRLHFHFSNILNKKFRALTNEFYQTLDGAENVKTMSQETWESCLDLTNKYLGYAMGAMYVNNYYKGQALFNSESQFVESNVVEAFKSSIDSIPWAGNSKITEMIKEKINSLISLRGYPNFIENTHSLEDYYKSSKVSPNNLMENIINGQLFLRKKEEEQLDKPVNSESSWTISPHDVSSLYQYRGNNLVIPAGLLQLSIFDPSSPNSVKFGSLGTILGSQIFKAFDEKGVMYNQFGILEPWLSDKSERLYKREASCIREKLGNETLHGNIEVNGKLALGETISDLAAVKFAYKAFKNNQQEQGLLPGLPYTGDELFFISYAQSMCQTMTPEKVRSLNEYSTSSPNHIRVVRALQQLPEFSTVFQCSSGSFMNPQNKCSIW